MSELVQCERRGKWLRGCRFEGRYDQHPGRPGRTEGDTAFTVAVLRAAKIATYVRDVCVTCGRTVERVPSPAPTGEETV